MTEFKDSIYDTGREHWRRALGDIGSEVAILKANLLASRVGASGGGGQIKPLSSQHQHPAATGEELAAGVAAGGAVEGLHIGG